jgi:hypothetical protein
LKELNTRKRWMMILILGRKHIEHFEIMDMMSRA